MLDSINVHKHRHFVDGKDCILGQSLDRIYPSTRFQWTILVANDDILIVEDKLFLDIFERLLGGQGIIDVSFVLWLAELDVDDAELFFVGVVVRGDLALANFQFSASIHERCPNLGILSTFRI